MTYGSRTGTAYRTSVSGAHRAHAATATVSAATTASAAATVTAHRCRKRPAHGCGTSDRNRERNTNRRFAHFILLLVRNIVLVVNVSPRRRFDTGR
jgi:hypothetical protein